MAKGPGELESSPTSYIDGAASVGALAPASAQWHCAISLNDPVVGSVFHVATGNG